MSASNLIHDASGLPLVNGNGNIRSLSQIPNGNSIASDLHNSYALSVREREQAALAAMGVSSTIGGHRALGPIGHDFDDHDYLEERMGELHVRQHPQDLFTRGPIDPYHQSVSGGSSVSSFSPESAPAARNVPLTQHQMNRIDLELRFPEEPVRNRGPGLSFNVDENEANATPVANLSGWPTTRVQQRELGAEGERQHRDLELRHETQRRLEDHESQLVSSRSASYSPPLSASALRSAESIDELGQERDMGSISYETGVGDSTLIPPGDLEHHNLAQEDHEQFAAQQQQRAPSRSSIPSQRSPTPHDDLYRTFSEPQPEQQESQQSSGGPRLESLSEEDERDKNERTTPSVTAEVGRWPRPASALSVSSRSGRSSVVHDGHLSSDQSGPEGPRQLQFRPQQQQRSFGSSSRGSGSPPELNGLPNVMPSHFEEDERDQVSPLHQQGFQSLHQHLPLSHLPRHQLPQQFAQFHQQRMQDPERSLHFNESIFDVRGGASRNQNDPAGLEARFNEFSIAAGTGILRENSPPIASPPLAPMQASRSSGHDSRANIDQNPPV